MTDLHTLEAILGRFDTALDDQGRPLFSHPRRLSNIHNDVTVKYVIAMGRTATEDFERRDIIPHFCDRFEVDKSEMDALLRKKGNWMDYRLFTALALHFQIQLGLEEENFIERITSRVFTDYQDRQIAMGKWVLNFEQILRGMPRAFKSWTKVVDIGPPEVTYANKKKGRIETVKLTRRTRDEYRNSLRDVVGEDFLRVILRRDCDFSVSSFETTFGVFFEQRDLTVERTVCESDTLESSVYIIRPERQYKTRRKRFWKNVQRMWKRKVLYVPLIGAVVAERRLLELTRANERLTDIIAGTEATIREQTETMAAKNAQLEDQLDTILNLMTQLQELRTSGDIHAIKNFTQRRRERERDSVMPNMATSIYLAYQQVQQDTFGLEYLMAICKPFGINGEDFDKPFAIETKLRKVVIQDLGTRVPTDKAKRSVIRSLREMYNPEIIDSITTRYFSTTRRHFQNQIDVLVDGLMKKKYTPLEVKEMFDHYMPGNPTSLFDSPKKKVISDALRKVLEKVAKPIPLESSYEAYLQAQEKYKERLQGHILKDFDPFSLFESLRGTLQMINYINRRFHDLGQAITLERVDFKTVLDRAYDIACPEDSDKPFYVDTRAMQLNPTFNTSSEVFATIIADRMFDVVRAGSPTFTIITREPNQNDILPFGDGIMDLESDALYLILENYGNPYQADVAEWNNEYLAGRRDTPMSTKGKGGGKGTERLKKFLDLYGAKCFIEPFQEETQQGTRYKILFPSLDFMR